MINKWSIFNHIVSDCFLCRQASNNGLLCPACNNDLPRVDWACRSCAAPLYDGISPICGRCLREPPPIAQTLATFNYRAPVTQLIQGFKFHDQLSVTHWMGQAMADRIRSSADPLPQILIPVPLHPQRLRQRGYNQSLLLARHLSGRLNIDLDSHSCTRITQGAPQADLSANQRWKNMRGAFCVGKSLNVPHVALIDDVMTTGATLYELANTLKQQGVQRVDAWVLARTGN